MATAPVAKLGSASASPSQVDEISDAQCVETLVRLVPKTRLFVLSCDEEVIEMVRTAAQSAARIGCARDLDHLLESLPNSDPDVLIIDGANNSIPATIARVARELPDAVTVIIGTREESNELLQMAAVGRIFRFLLRPLSSGPVRLAIAAAVSRCTERKANLPRRPAAVPSEAQPHKKSWVAIGALGVTLLVMIGGIWVAADQLSAKPQPQAAVAAPVVPSPVEVLVAAAPDATRDPLSLAQRALAEGRITEAGGALELYRSILSKDPANADALAGIRAVGDALLARAEQSLLEESLDAAQQTLTLAREADAENPRLSFVGLQLTRERERRNLRQLRLRRLVAEARTDIQDGNLLGWVSGGAVDALLEARKIDPRDAEVVQGVRDLTVALADAVRKAAAEGNPSRARAYTTAAVRLGVSPAVLQTMQRSLNDARKRDDAVAPPGGSQ
jgi:hypothetical protein